VNIILFDGKNFVIFSKIEVLMDKFKTMRIDACEELKKGIQNF